MLYGSATQKKGRLVVAVREAVGGNEARNPPPLCNPLCPLFKKGKGKGKQWLRGSASEEAER